MTPEQKRMFNFMTINSRYGKMGVDFDMPQYPTDPKEQAALLKTLIATEDDRTRKVAPNGDVWADDTRRMIYYKTVPNPRRKWWSFWRPKTVTIVDIETFNCRCVIKPFENTDEK